MSPSEGIPPTPSPLPEAVSSSQVVEQPLVTVGDLGLLFLLAKETKTQGVVQVTVQGPNFVHFTQIPVYHPSAVSDVNSRVNFARSLTAAAS
jgi:hypothetical protein